MKVIEKRPCLSCGLATLTVFMLVPDTVGMAHQKLCVVLELVQMSSDALL